MKTLLRMLGAGLAFIGLVLAPLPSVAQSPQLLPFDAATWTGNRWCFNGNWGYWFPTVNADGSATFIDALGDYC